MSRSCDTRAQTRTVFLVHGNESRHRWQPSVKMCDSSMVVFLQDLLHARSGFGTRAPFHERLDLAGERFNGREACRRCPPVTSFPSVARIWL